jgi:hypothetical protein
MPPPTMYVSWYRSARGLPSALPIARSALAVAGENVQTVGGSETIVDDAHQLC